MAYKTKRTIVGDDQLALVKSKSAYTLPDNPSDKGFSASQIKAKLYDAIIYIFYLLKNVNTATGSELTEIEDELSKILDGTSIVKKAEKDASGNVITTYYAKATALADEILRSTAKDDTHDSAILAINTEEGKHVHVLLDSNKAPYAKYPSVNGEVPVSSTLLTRSDGDNIAKSINSVTAALAAFYSLSDSNKQEIANILNGTYKAKKAETADKALYDSSGNKINVALYGKKVTLTYVQSTGVMTAHLFNQDNVEISSADYNLPTELIFDSQGYDASTKKLWFHPVGNAAGDNVEIDVTDLFDVYTGGNTSTVKVHVVNNIITAEIDDGVLSLSKLDPTFTAQIDAWADAEALRASNETTRQENEVTRQNQETVRQNQETARENAYALYKDASGCVCVAYDHLKTVS